MTEDLIVEGGDVTKFPREARLPEVDLLVEDDTEPEPPTDVHIERGADVAVLSTAGCEFAERHASGVVVNRYPQSELTAQDLRQGAITEEVE